IYSSPYSGIDNICAVETSTGKQYKITTSRFGAFFPSISENKNKLLYSDYNFNGMDIVSAEIDPDTWIPFDEASVNRIDYFKNSNNLYIKRDLTDEKEIPVKLFKVRKYNALKNMINFHSRVLLPYQIEPAVEFYSGNKLNTTFLTGGFSYNTNEKAGKLYTEAVYAGMFPVFKIGFSHGNRNTGDSANLKWNETTMDFSVLIPLDLSRGVFIRNLDLQAEVSLTKISGSNEYDGHKIRDGNINSSSFSLRFSNIKRFSKRDLAPETGQFLSAEYSFTPWDNYYKGERLFVRGSLYFPGLFKHNSIKIGFSYEQQHPVNYIYSGNIRFSRGYDYEFNDNLMFATFDYTFPVAYPDLILGELFYLKRIKAGIFADLGKG
ncbi:MAG: hypothetical protein KAR14_08850, partial [Candidatus Aminicenantes bacterium]|nr:hypothetical protein [Candidatus Aminicenantes bacterium]